MKSSMKYVDDLEVHQSRQNIASRIIIFITGIFVVMSLIISFQTNSYPEIQPEQFFETELKSIQNIRLIDQYHKIQQDLEKPEVPFYAFINGSPVFVDKNGHIFNVNFK